MPDGVSIPADMLRPELNEQFGCEAVVSIRDMMICLGATDEQLRDMDERDEILEREPWRKDGLGFQVTATMPNGMQLGFSTGEIDWSGTRFAKVAE